MPIIFPIKRIFSSAWISLKRQASLTLATCFITFLTIFLMTFLFFFHSFSQFLISEFKEKVDVSVYFKENSLAEDILKVKDEISKLPEVKAVEYVSKDEALERFIERHRDDPVIMESLAAVGGNPFLASLSIKVWQARDYEKILSFFEEPLNKNLIEKIDYYQRKPVIERVFSITNAISRLTITLILVFGIISFLVAFNTIRLAIYNLREEIRIQRLVGASNWFIRGPFLAQGLIIGLFSVFFTLFLTSILTYFLSPKIAILLPSFNFFDQFKNHFWTLLLIQLLTGIAIGVFSSLIAIRKYLEV